MNELELRRRPLWHVALGAAAVYLAWLHFGTRSNPPIPYDKFRTGLTFAQVREELGEESRRAYNRGEYMWVGRATVLGRMRELKLRQYERYLEGYREGDEDLPF